MFLFLNDQETQAWRCIGTVMRLVQELCPREAESHHKMVTDELYWTVYTLDRRWSFGTSLPFSVPSTDITRQPVALVSCATNFLMNRADLHSMTRLSHLHISNR